MDNDDNTQNNGFFPNFGQPHFFHDIIHGIVHTLNAPDSNGNNGQAASEMTSAQPVPLTDTREHAGVSTTIDVATLPISHNAEDVDMAPPIESEERSTLSVEVDNAQEDEYESMPDLQSISSSSDEDESSMDDADEVEMIQGLQAVDDDNDSAWTDDDGHNHTPTPQFAHPTPTVPLRSARRARVDDDDDEDRDRRHPSQRTATPADPNAHQPRAAPPPHPHPHFHIPTFVRVVSESGNQPAPDSVRILQRLFARPPTQRRNPGNNPAQDNNNITNDSNNANSNANNNANNIANNNANNNANNPEDNPWARRQAVPIFAGGFTVTLGTGPPPGVNVNGGAAGTPAAPNQPTNAPGGATGAGRPENIDLTAFADLIGRFGVGLGQMFAMEVEKEQEDPERAKKLVDGLEEVPMGLVRRLERVGGAPGGHVDGSEGSPVDAPGCAICWDSLLDAESDGFVAKQNKDEESQEPSGETTVPRTTVPSESSQPVVHEPSSTPSEPESSASSLPSNDSTKETTHPKIVCLPCTHVFHASCLIPWFSRPGQTTCPTCRFNIDPENLTYVWRRPTQQTQTQAGPMTDGAGVIVVTADEGTNVPGGAAGGQIPAGPEVGPPSSDAAADVPQPTVPTGSDDAAPPPADQPAPAPPPEFGETAGFWTFGFDMVVEHRHQPGEGEGQQPGGTQREEGGDADMANGVEDNQEGETRREAEAIAEQFLDQIGFAMGPGAVPPTDGGNNEAPPGGNGAQPPNPMAGFAQMFTGVMGGHGAVPGGIHVMPQWQPQNANTGPPPAGAPPPAQPGGDPPTGDGPNIPNFPEFRQFFGFPGPNGTGGPPAPQGFTVLQGFPAHVHGGAPPPASHTPREKRPWTPPPHPGLTLRQRVEQKEREVGLRCFDVSCGLGPSDEEPWSNASDASMKQLLIRPLKNDLLTGARTSVCPHTFHPACLVSAERVAFGGREKVEGGEVGVSCPVCRAPGCISSEEWVEGAVELG